MKDMRKKKAQLVSELEQLRHEVETLRESSGSKESTSNNSQNGQGKDFFERLESTLELLAILSRVDSLDELCRAAVELGQPRLGMDRIGVWLIDPQTPTHLQGTYGIDAEGNLRDEHELTLPLQLDNWPCLNSKEKSLKPFTKNNVEIVDFEGKKGKGGKAMVLLWDGEGNVGLISADTLVSKRPITVEDTEILSLYAASLGPMITGKRAKMELFEQNSRLSLLNEVG